MDTQFKPFNRHIWIAKSEEKESEAAVLLPDGYQSKQGPEFSVVEVIALAEGVENMGVRVEPGDSIVVRNHMIESVNVAGKTFHTILSNHVVGKLGG